MKKIIYSILSLFTLLLIFSCGGDSVSEEFENANGNVQKKLMKSISVTSSDSSVTNTITFSYTSNNQLNTISNGNQTSVFIYENKELKNVTGGNDKFNVEKLYESPYDAFNEGNITEYDTNGNPKTIEFFEEVYNFNNQNLSTKIYTANISYDKTHNPYFYTLEAGGIIQILDGVKLNFSMNPQIPEIVKARMLFPVNNLSQVIYKNDEGETVNTININYEYDSENYPTSATATVVSVKGSKQTIYSTEFKYVN